MKGRRIRLADHRGRDAVVALVAPPRESAEIELIEGNGSKSDRVARTRRIKATADYTESALRKRLSDSLDAIAAALVAGDPELDIEVVGRETGRLRRVFVDRDGRPLYAATIMEEIVSPDGTRRERRVPENVAANLLPDLPPVWSNRYVSQDRAVCAYAKTRLYHVRHVDGLTFDFLFGIARHLAERGQLVVVGAGPKGVDPLRLERNSLPMTGLLEGRTQGHRYMLRLHLAAFRLRLPMIPA